VHPHALASPEPNLALHPPTPGAPYTLHRPPLHDLFIQPASVNYSHSQVMDVYETFVPEAERGRGLGVRLARAAFAIARDHGWFIRPSCTYISDHFLGSAPTHPDGRAYADDLLFSACAEGMTLRSRRAELGKLPAKELTRRCAALVERGSGPKGALVERLLAAEFGPLAAKRAAEIAARARYATAGCFYLFRSCSL